MKDRRCMVIASVVLLSAGGCGGGGDDVGGQARRAVTSVSQQAEEAMRLRVALSGSAELKPGDPDGAGSGTFEVDARAGRLCYEVSVQRLDNPVGMHVHEGEAGADGPVVIPLETPGGGDSPAKACTEADRALLARIAAEPGGFYVNVHTETYPQGAVRGQLGR